MKSSILTILIISLIIASFGILSVYSSTYQKDARLWQAQIIWALLGLAVFFLFSILNYRRLWDATYVLYVLVIILLFLVFILGSIRSGAQRWLRLAWFNIQPSELAKLIIVVFLARYFSKKSVSSVSLSAVHFGIIRGLVLPFLFVAIPMGLIVEQPDLGSGLIVLFIFVAMLFLTKLKLRYLVIFLLFIGLSMPVLWGILRDYQKERLLVFLNPNIDPLGAGYTLIQSKIAIGSGMLFGKGWLAGTQSQLRFLPESHTDFIFATFSEQWGFLGCAVLLILYFILFREGFLIARRTSDHFASLLASGISLLLGIQVFVNIAMTMGLMPVVGIPLPLMSYGGSSIIVNFMALGILVNIARTRAVF